MQNRSETGQWLYEINRDRWLTDHPGKTAHDYDVLHGIEESRSRSDQIIADNNAREKAQDEAKFALIGCIYVLAMILGVPAVITCLAVLCFGVSFWPWFIFLVLSLIVLRKTGVLK